MELKTIQQRIGITTIFVTHDQDEALAMSDKIVVMRHGSVAQIGLPEQVYNAPANEFVANFLGASNILDGRCTGRSAVAATVDLPGFGAVAVPAERAGSIDAGQPCRVMIRAEKLRVSADPAAEGRVAARALVEAVDYQGQLARYFLRLGEAQLQAMTLIDGSPLKAGSTVTVSFSAADCSVLPPEA